MEARRSREGGLTRGSSAAAEATISRAVPVAARVQGAGPRGRHAKVRCHSPVGIDLERRERQNRAPDVAVGRPFERSEEESGIGRQLLDIAVGGHDDQRRGRCRSRCGCGRECLCSRREAGKDQS
jgi:hypothetical protein